MALNLFTSRSIISLLAGLGALLLLALNLEAQTNVDVNNPGSWRLKKVYQEGPQPVLGDLLESSFQVPQYPLPSLGNQPGFLSFAYLRSLLPQNLGLVMVGQGLFFLPRQGISIHETAFVSQLLEFIHKNLSYTPAAFFLEGLNLPNILGKNWEFTWDKPLAENWKEGKVEIRWQTTTDKKWQKIPLKLSLRTLIQVPQLKQGIKAGEVLNNQAIKNNFVRPSFVRGDLLWVDSGTSWTAKRSLVTGEILTTDMVKRVLEVNRGDTVRATITRGALAVELLGKAQGEGSIGETVQIKLDTTGKIISAQIVGPREVKSEVP